MPRCLLLSLLLLPLALAAPATADSLLTLKSHVDSFQVAGETQPAKDTEIHIWAANDKLRRDEGETTAILRLDRNKLYVVRHKDKTFHVRGDLKDALPLYGQWLWRDKGKMVVITE